MNYRTVNKTCPYKNISNPPAKEEIHRVVMMRTGEYEGASEIFCGWYNSLITEKGKSEAKVAAVLLKNGNYKFNKAYASLLSRSRDTLNIVLEELAQNDIEIVASWRLNPKHYGSLTGLTISETAAKLGGNKLEAWQNNFNLTPPPMEPNHVYFEAITNDPIYSKSGLTVKDIPSCESMEQTFERVIPLWEEQIVPFLKAGNEVLIVGHGASLKALIFHLENDTAEGIVNLKLPLAIPFVYTLDSNMKPIGGRQFLKK